IHAATGPHGRFRHVAPWASRARNRVRSRPRTVFENEAWFKSIGARVTLFLMYGRAAPATRISALRFPAKGPWALRRQVLPGFEPGRKRTQNSLGITKARWEFGQKKFEDHLRFRPRAGPLSAPPPGRRGRSGKTCAISKKE